MNAGTAQIDTAAQMPSRHAMVHEAIARLDTLGLRSGLVKLDTVTLHNLCMRLTDRSITIAEAHRRLNEELGLDAHDAIDDNQVYRFADHFRRIYGQVRAEHARRLAKLTVAHATDANIEAMTRVAQNRLVELMAEQLVDADNLEDLDHRQLNAILTGVRFAQGAQTDAAKIALAREQAEQRARELEARVEKLNLQIAEQKLRHQRAADAAKREADRKADESGDGRVDRRDVYAMIDAVMKGESL